MPLAGPIAVTTAMRSPIFSSVNQCTLPKSFIFTCTMAWPFCLYLRSNFTTLVFISTNSPTDNIQSEFTAPRPGNNLLSKFKRMVVLLSITRTSLILINAGATASNSLMSKSIFFSKTIQNKPLRSNAATATSSLNGNLILYSRLLRSASIFTFSASTIIGL